MKLVWTALIGTAVLLNGVVNAQGFGTCQFASSGACGGIGECTVDGTLQCCDGGIQCGSNGVCQTFPDTGPLCDCQGDCTPEGIASGGCACVSSINASNLCHLLINFRVTSLIHRQIIWRKALSGKIA
jgi:hypothetical protein